MALKVLKADQIPSSKLRIGYSTEDILFPVHPGLKRAVMEAKSVLESLGHTLVPFALPDPSKVIRWGC